MVWNHFYPAQLYKHFVYPVYVIMSNPLVGWSNVTKNLPDKRVNQPSFYLTSIQI